MNIERLEKLLYIAESLGDTERVNMYDKDSIYIEGTTKDGMPFNLSLVIKKEDEKNA